MKIASRLPKHIAVWTLTFLLPWQLLQVFAPPNYLPCLEEGSGIPAGSDLLGYSVSDRPVKMISGLCVFYTFSGHDSTLNSVLKVCKVALWKGKRDDRYKNKWAQQDTVYGDFTVWPCKIMWIFPERSERLICEVWKADRHKPIEEKACARNQSSVHG